MKYESGRVYVDITRTLYKAKNENFNFAILPYDNYHSFRMVSLANPKLEVVFRDAASTYGEEK